MTDIIDLAKLDRALADAAPRLGRTGQQVDAPLLSFLQPDRGWDDHVMATFCHHVLHFTGPETARRWSDRHEGTFVLDLDAGVELARRHVERTFGEAPPRSGPAPWRRTATSRARGPREHS